MQQPPFNEYSSQFSPEIKHRNSGHYSHLSDITPPPVTQSPYDFNSDSYQPYASERVYENFDVNVKPNRYTHHSCIDVAEHAHHCLVCSKLYTNNNTLLLIIIAFFALVNLLLLKKIFETEK
jgi:hypothetical protein